MPKTPEDMKPNELVTVLLDNGYTPERIASMLEGRVSPRTIYRWARQQSEPQNATTVSLLRRLVAEVG